MGLDEDWNKQFGDGNNKETDPKAKQVIQEASELIMSKFTFITIEETGEIWYHKDGVYVQGGEILIAKECEKMFDYDLNNDRLSQIKGHIMRRTYHKREELDIDTNIINLKNGLYKIDEDELLPHDPNYCSFNQKPIMYIKNAKPKRFGTFLGEVLYPREIRTAVEAMAYTFERDYPIEVIFILYGFGANGKTVYTSTMTKIHGKDNVSNVPLTEMLGDRFALSDLENKDVNIDNELAGQSIKETAVLKRLTGGSRQHIRIQRKNQRAYDTKLYTKLFFNANKVPVSGDDSDAYNRRVTPIAFPNRFEGKNEDKQLISKLTTDEELAGIFNVLMKALRRIRKTNSIYINEKTIEEKRIKYQRTTKPIKAFIDEAVAEDSTADTPIRKEEFYEAYVKFCKKYSLPTERYEPFCGHIKQFRFDGDITEIKETRRDVGDTDKEGKPKKTQCWVGIILKPDYIQRTEQQRLV